MKTKRAGFATKIVILVLLVACALALLSLQTRLQQAQEELDAANQQVEDQIARNDALTDAIENRDDPDRIGDIARSQLDLLAPDEKVYVDIAD